MSSSSVLSSLPPSPPPQEPPPRRSKRKMGLDINTPAPKKAKKIQHQAVKKNTVVNTVVKKRKNVPAAAGLRRSRRKMKLEPEFGLLPEVKRVKKSKILDEDGMKEIAATEKKEKEAENEKEKEKEKTPDAEPGPVIEENAPEEENPEEEEKSEDEIVQQWRHILNQGLTTAHASRDADSEYQVWQTWDSLPPFAKEFTETPPLDFIQIESSENLWGNDVYLAIATLWHAAKDPLIGHPMAFVNYDGVTMSRFPNLDHSGCRAPLFAAVGGPEDLLIPVVMDKTFVSPPNSAGLVAPETGDAGVYVNEKGETQGKDGHIFLVIAHLNGDGTVLLTRMDSCTQAYPHDRISRSAYRVVRKSGWLCMNNQGFAEEMDVDPSYTSELQPCVQQRSTNSCGIHTILNAWVRILGLPPLLGEQRSVYPARAALYANDDDEEDKFILGALELVNLALSGHLDARTVQAFLNFWGFVQLQDPAGELVAEVKTMRMTEDVLTAVMNEQRDVEMVGKKQPETRKWPVRSIGEVKVALGCGRDKALEMLEVCEGDVDTAIVVGRQLETL
ncbi:MAG: hypothetical protein Q9174_004365 [Haloplaca sp. 1 TL-2023]